MMLFKFSKKEYKEEITRFRGNESNNNSIYKMFNPIDSHNDLYSGLLCLLFTWVTLLFFDEIKQVISFNNHLIRNQYFCFIDKIFNHKACLTKILKLVYSDT